MQEHFTLLHPSAKQSKFESLWLLSNFEEQEMCAMCAALRDI
jgi:hypothetical protein